MDAATPAAVLDFWFGDTGQARVEWFRKDPAFDATIAARFGPTIERALADGLADWGDTPAATLARIVVLDQFTRNVFRGTGRSFAGDSRALALAQALVERGDDRRLSPLQRWFAYLPFEHAEDLAMQDASVRLFESLAREAPSCADAAEWARRHRDVIVRFGRYPHRNALLGRVGTPEESAYLAEPGSGF